MLAGDVMLLPERRRAEKPGQMVPEDVELEVVAAPEFVSRGGIKLANALDKLELDVAGAHALDVGASTGGFSDVLLARGARLVYAVDVGHGQLHERLRARADLVSFEHTDIRRLDAARLPERPEVVAIDVSFISLKLVLPAALALAARRMQMLALIKPQFEAPRRSNKKGIVRDPAIHDAVCHEMTAFVASLGCTVSMLFPSEIAGGDGNREFFIAAYRD